MSNPSLPASPGPRTAELKPLAIATAVATAAGALVGYGVGFSVAPHLASGLAPVVGGQLAALGAGLAGLVGLPLAAWLMPSLASARRMGVPATASLSVVPPRPAPDPQELAATRARLLPASASEERASPEHQPETVEGFEEFPATPSLPARRRHDPKPVVAPAPLGSGEREYVPPPVALSAILPPGSLAEAMAQDNQRSVRDGLTGAYTQQHFLAAADREWSRIRRHGEDAALLMVDVDHFASLNESHGRICGDLVLVEVTRQVSAMLRQYDLLARFGGGVLMVYLPHTDPLGALDVAERIRDRVATYRMHHDGKPVRATVSVGVAAIGASHAHLDEAIADAGSALREAKDAGRNCVRAAPIPPRLPTAKGSASGLHRP